MITKVSHNELLQNIKDSYKTTTLAIAIAIATNTKDRTNRSREINIKNRNVENYPDTQKFNNEYSRSYQSYTSRTHNNQLQHSLCQFYEKTKHGNENTRTQN